MKMLKPRVTMLSTPRVKTVQVDRLRGSAWMKIIKRIMRRDNGLCQCEDCKASGRLLVAHQVDHIIELADGGNDDDSNLRAMNVDCHARKSAAAAAARRGW